MSNPHFISRDKCPACTGASRRTIYQCPFDEPPVKDYLEGFYAPQGGIEWEYLKGATYWLSSCDACGLIFQREIPDDHLMERLYEHWIDPQRVLRQHQLDDVLGRCSHHAQEIMQLLAYFDEPPCTLSFLDFGMGWGDWALMAKACGCDSYGLELSRERIEHARSNGIMVVTWDQMSQHRFNFVNTEQVFEHIPEPLDTLCQLKKALKPGGMVKISVPTVHDIERRLQIMDWKSPRGARDSLNGVAPLEHINCFKRASLVTMARAAGMEEVFVPMSRQYQYASDWGGMRKIAKNLLRPIYRNILKRQNCLFFRNASQPEAG